MSAQPPFPNDSDPSARYSFDDAPRGGMHVHPQAQQRQTRRTENDDQDSLADLILDTIDTDFGLTERALGCAWWSMTLPFRLLWKIIGFFFD